MTDFLPADYEVPSASNGYMKLKPGENRFRILAPALLGVEVWTNENKPLRFKPGEPIEQSANFKSSPKHFMAFPVWNYEDKRFQILQLTQKRIMTAIAALSKNKKWGSPFDYDIVIVREGEGMNDTTYTVTPDPKEPFDPKLKKEFEKLNIKIEKLYEGGDPFSDVTEEKEEAEESLDYGTNETKPSDLPF